MTEYEILWDSIRIVIFVFYSQYFLSFFLFSNLWRSVSFELNVFSLFLENITIQKFDRTSFALEKRLFDYIIANLHSNWNEDIACNINKYISRSLE